MEVDSEEEDEIDIGGQTVNRGGVMEIDNDEVRPHAGTGGSSKMKSRPN